MKTLLRIAAFTVSLALLLSAFSCCRYFVNGGDFVLKADRYTIQPNGSDYPTLFFFNKDGSEIKSANVSVYVNGARVKRGRVTMTEEGSVEVYATYNGMTSNTIFISSEYNSNLPVIVIDVGKHRVNQQVAVTGDFYLYEQNEDGRTLFGKNSAPSVQSACTVKIRGQSSAQIYTKKQYKIHLQNPDGTNNNVSLLGMPKENDWIINGTYGDKTIMHNYLAYTLESQMDFKWAPRVRYVEVYITHDRNDMSADEYLGLYVLTESIKVDKNRVDITRGDGSTDPEKIGYIFAKDKGADGSAAIRSNYDTYKLEYPNPDTITRPQRRYLADKITEFENALYGADFTDPEKGYRAYIDADSYIDAILLTELMKNVDGIRLSNYFSLDKNGKIVCGPAWDFDLSCGTCNYGMDAEKPTGFIFLDKSYRNSGDYAWADRMMQDPWFANRLVERYRELRGAAFSEENIQSIIDKAYYEVIESATRNAGRWPELYDGHTYIWPNAFTFTSYTAAVNDLKEWLHERVVWLDEYIGWLNGEVEKYREGGSRPGRPEGK